tara:strand:+ start:902 stop:1825 length:924 start_codon:yes stop_codon:yes gene_type:complete
VDETLRDLLGIRTVNLRPSKFHSEVHGFSCLGVADSVPDITSQYEEVFIWHASHGILPITGSELTRWALDAPMGFHWILSERPVEGELEKMESMEVVIWGPEDVSHWLGEAVLMGELVAKAPEEESPPQAPNVRILENSPLHRSLPPLIDPSSWLSQRGMEGIGYSPVLLEARLWTVTGHLRGPNGELDSGTWSLFEDPWSPSLSILEDLETLQQAPDLRKLEPKSDTWISQDRFSDEVGKLLEVRRKGSYEESNISGSVRSIILQRWTFSSDDADIYFSPINIPGWIIHFETNKILHGRNGRLYES